MIISDKTVSSVAIKAFPTSYRLKKLHPFSLNTFIGEQSIKIKEKFPRKLSLHTSIPYVLLRLRLCTFQSPKLAENIILTLSLKKNFLQIKLHTFTQYLSSSPKPPPCISKCKILTLENSNAKRPTSK